MTGPLQDRTVLVVARGCGIARAIVIASRDAGAHVVAAGLDENRLAAEYADEPSVTVQFVDLTDDASTEALGKRLESVDHVVSTASARARGHLKDLDRESIRLSFDTKVVGPLMLAKYLAPRTNDGGSFVIFSGVAAFKIAVGTMAEITNQRSGRDAGPFACPGVDSHPGEWHFTPGSSTRGLTMRSGSRGRPTIRRYQLAQPDQAHRHTRGHRRRRPVCDD
jgi:NAD(P)-dependent dehydrogenase (short-subunit alcohol dehydrogenase family)